MTRGQRRDRRAQIAALASASLPPELAPQVADTVFQHECRAKAAGEPFDAAAHIAEIGNQCHAEALHRQKVADNEENDVELLLFGT